MLRILTWPSQETSARLTPAEVEVLFNFTSELNKCGQLGNGTYVGASQPIYWERTKGGN